MLSLWINSIVTLFCPQVSLTLVSNYFWDLFAWCKYCSSRFLSRSHSSGVTTVRANGEHPIDKESRKPLVSKNHRSSLKLSRRFFGVQTYGYLSFFCEFVTFLLETQFFELFQSSKFNFEFKIFHSTSES